MSGKILIIFLIFSFLTSSHLIAQDQNINLQGNTGNIWLETGKGNLFIGGYGELDYNQSLIKGIRQNGKLDVHRLVLLFGYKFNPKFTFISEIEFEHVQEVYIEQFFFNYRFKDYLNFRAGLLLIPMGIVNEFHEPTTFLGVERPLIDKVIVPTTWREIGAGFSGNIQDASLKYQLYLVNGFKSYDNGEAKLNGSKGFRSGRQKAAESIISHPNLSAKLSFYGLRGLELGLSVYTGKTQTTAYQGIDKNNSLAKQYADSTVVNINMLGLDARYRNKGLLLRGQVNYSNVGNTEQYNAIEGTDLGSAILGYYVETGYNLLKSSGSNNYQLIPFVRYSQYDTHFKVNELMERNEAYAKTVITSGINFMLNDALCVKADYQFIKSKANEDWNNQLNLGFGVWFR